ncbi:SDR family NAD(P)-dependent oxidoreductase [Fusibacter paucivorans]|uniref:SDR family NAD(P)-dependent oxidoreductase n=1 Tax=Fusibacter paucivorans TaxID=76009 RepID=A0ABS5PS64_9FIRM|nr:SDR family NAD(P)-dependent oxidoreductase [Fusibacter paucivorans]MBS7526907.1 SDR family NAD(P)-dependent oxidoreductase [Fusibacter paucivorans]
MEKICFITGGNAGIGRAAAIQIASKGYRVIIGCRNLSRGQEAVAYIKQISQSEAVELVQIDLSLFHSIEQCAEYLHTHFDHIDVLIHNAAIFDIAQKEPIFSSEGHETIWMTNHIGPVYLTSLVQDLVEKSDDGRVITIASKGLLAMPGLRINLEDPEFRRRHFSVTKAYYQSKLAQIMFTYWLSSMPGITANCIRVTAVKVDLDRHPNLSSFQKLVYRLKSKKTITPEQMAETYLYLATAQDLMHVSGKYFDEHGQIIHSGKYTCDQTAIENVKSLTEMFIKEHTHKLMQ